MGNPVENNLNAKVIPLRPVDGQGARTARRSGSVAGSEGSVDPQAASGAIAFQPRSVRGSGLHGGVPHPLTKLCRQLCADVNGCDPVQLNGNVEPGFRGDGVASLRAYIV